MPTSGVSGACGFPPAEIGLPTNGEGRRHHHERFDGGADIFGLLVAVRVVRIGWLLAEPERYQRREGSDDVMVVSSASEYSATLPVTQ